MINPVVVFSRYLAFKRGMLWRVYFSTGGDGRASSVADGITRYEKRQERQNPSWTKWYFRESPYLPLQEKIHMDLNLKDKVIIVSGGSKGIGEGITRAIAAEGGIPFIATRSEGETRALVEELERNGSKAGYALGDLQDLDFCEQVARAAVARFGGIYGLVNNAGVNDGAGLEKGPRAFRASVQLNLFHYYDLTHFALPYLKESRGAIVNISSKVALTGQGGTSGYAAAKGAQLALTREWAAELLPHGIRVNAILPAEVMTPLYRKWLDTFDDPAAKERAIVAKIPLGKRMTTIEEMGALAVFLLSDKSSHTTGQFLIADGGYVHLDRALT
jgi:L-fucose dehydrogenase